MIPDCRLCGNEFTGRGQDPSDTTHWNCQRSIEYSLSCLAANLAIGGALCEAFEQGFYDVRFGVDWRPGHALPAAGGLK